MQLEAFSSPQTRVSLAAPAKETECSFRHAVAAIDASAELPPHAASFFHIHVDLVDYRNSVAGITRVVSVF